MDEQKKKNSIQSIENPSGMIHHSHMAALQDIGNNPHVAPLLPPPPRPPPLSMDENNDKPSSYIENSFDSNNQVSFETRILWKREEYTLPPLVMVPSIDQALFHLKTKSHYQEHLNKTADEKEKSMVTSIYKILEEFITKNFDTVQSSIQVSNIVLSNKGVYIAHLDNISLPKFGFTLNFGQRFQFLENVCFAAKIDVKLNNDSVNETIEQILNQDCPLLQYHRDQKEKLHETIFFHLQELIVACAFQTCTKTIGELFFSLPSKQVREILTLSEETNIKLNQISSKIPKLHCLYEIYTWPTLSSHLESLAEMDPRGFLAKKIPPNTRPFGFVTNYLNASCLLPSVAHSYKDAVDCCPRAEQVAILVKELKNAIDSDENIVETINSWTNTYGTSSYVHPC